MHSSRMRTGRSLTVLLSLLPGVVSASGGVSASRGVSAPRGCLLKGVSAPGGMSAPTEVSAWGGVWASQHALRQTPPLLTESQTPVKTLPWPNFVAVGNYMKTIVHKVGINQAQNTYCIS